MLRELYGGYYVTAISNTKNPKCVLIRDCREARPWCKEFNLLLSHFYRELSVFPLYLCDKINREDDKGLRALHFLMNGFLIPTGRIKEVTDAAMECIKTSSLIPDKDREQFVEGFAEAFDTLRSISPSIYKMVTLLDPETLDSELFWKGNIGIGSIEIAADLLNHCEVSEDGTVTGFINQLED